MNDKERLRKCFRLKEDRDMTIECNICRWILNQGGRYSTMDIRSKVRPDYE